MGHFSNWAIDYCLLPGSMPCQAWVGVTCPCCLDEFFFVENSFFRNGSIGGCFKPTDFSISDYGLEGVRVRDSIP